jgi:hypothetical protein
VKLPQGATIADRPDDEGNVRPHVKLKDKKGRAVWYPLTEDRTGYLKPTPCHYAVYTGVDGKQKREKGFTDYDQTLRLAVEREQEAERESADPSYRHHRRPLAEHLDDFEMAPRAKGNTPAYVALVKGRLKALFVGCKFEAIEDLSASAAAEWLAEQRDEKLAKDGETVKAGMSIQTSNYHLTHLKGFVRWMVRDRRMKSNPFEHLQGGNIRTDRRHDRRELTADELRKILESAR